MRKATILIEGKTIKDISRSTGIPENTIRRRYFMGDTTLDRMARPMVRNREYFKAPDAGKRMLDIIFANGMTLSDLSRKTGISRSTLYVFLYDGKDISATRLMKICCALNTSMDYIMKGA